MDRVKWFRLRALLERSKEEQETLEEEFTRTAASFHKSAEIWGCLAAESEAPGRKAYAEKQVDMYTALSNRCAMARETLPELLQKDLVKQEAKEAKEAERAKKLSASAEENAEDLWETLGKLASDIRSVN